MKKNNSLYYVFIKKLLILYNKDIILKNIIKYSKFNKLFLYINNKIIIILNMKKILRIFILLTILIYQAVCTYSKESTKTSEWGENSSVFSKGFENQEPVSDNKLNKTIQMLKERSMTKKQKKQQAEVVPLSPSSDVEHLKNFVSEETDFGQALTVMIPMSAYNDEGKVIPPGYYKLSCRKTSENNYILDLSQGTRIILSIEAVQTRQDLEQDTISFCNAEIIDNNRIRLVYGSIDLNLVGYLYFK